MTSHQLQKKQKQGSLNMQTNQPTQHKETQGQRGRARQIRPHHSLPFVMCLIAFYFLCFHWNGSSQRNPRIWLQTGSEQQERFCRIGRRKGTMERFRNSKARGQPTGKKRPPPNEGKSWELKTMSRTEAESGPRERLTGCQGGGAWETDGAEVGVSRCKLLHIEWISNKVFL